MRWAGHPQSTAPLHVALAPRLQAYTTQQREQSAAEDPVPRTRRPEENLALVAYVAHTDTPFSTKSGRTVTDDNMICNQVSRQKKKPKERERDATDDGRTIHFPAGSNVGVGRGALPCSCPGSQTQATKRPRAPAPVCVPRRRKPHQRYAAPDPHRLNCTQINCSSAPQYFLDRQRGIAWHGRHRGLGLGGHAAFSRGL